MPEHMPVFYHNDSAWVVRLMEASELENVLSVYRQCEDFLALGPVAQASLEMVQADVEISKSQGGHYCGIFTEQGDSPGELAGILDYIPSGFEGRAECAFLELLLITPAYRSRGLGGAVVDWLVKRLQESGVKTLRSGVQVNNPQAVRFWEQHGFQRVSGPIRMPDQTVVYELQRDL